MSYDITFEVEVGHLLLVTYYLFIVEVRNLLLITYYLFKYAI